MANLKVVYPPPSGIADTGLRGAKIRAKRRRPGGYIPATRPQSIGQQLKIAQDRAEVLRLRREGHSYQSIAATTNLSVATVGTYVQAELIELREKTSLDVQSMRDLELQRLDEDLRALGPGRRAGDPTSIATAVRISERRAKILGLDAPTQHEVNGNIIVTAEAVAKMPDSDLSDRVTALAKRLGLVSEEPKQVSGQVVPPKVKAKVKA
jgi:hypothetical protein